MILTVAATEFEFQPFGERVKLSDYERLICGVGPLESCLRLARYLEQKSSDISMVVNFGVAGAYCSEKHDSPGLLDICVAKTEYFGDLGICFPRRIDDLPENFGQKKFLLDPAARKVAEQELQRGEIKHYTGNFVTVSCVSGTRERGAILQRKHQAICENMEGAALARVCEEYSVPLLQIRCISNMVDNREPGKWKLTEAAEKCGKIVAFLVERLG